MPYLPLEPSIISNPTRVDLSIIGSFMLWPDDETVRNEAFNSAVIEMGKELDATTELGAEALRGLFHLAADNKPIGQLHEMVKARYPNGVMAGNILIAAIQGKDDEGEKLRRGDISKKLAKKFAPRRGDNSSFVSAIWTQYRCVSHFWAAHVKYTEATERPTFPCDLNSVACFLSLSEEWRQRGETTKTAPRAPSTVLRPNECWRVPEWMKFSKKDWNTH
jgi:hypothetical protein